MATPVTITSASSAASHTFTGLQSGARYQLMTTPGTTAPTTGNLYARHVLASGQDNRVYDQNGNPVVITDLSASQAWLDVTIIPTSSSIEVAMISAVDGQQVDIYLTRLLN